MKYQPLIDGKVLEQEPLIFKGLDEYLSERSHLGPQRICGVLKELSPQNDQKSPESNGASKEKSPESSAGPPRRYLPWLTLVLGTETLAPAINVSLEQIADRVATIAKAYKVPEPEAHDIRQFVHSMLSRRIDDADKQSDDSFSLELSDWEICLLHAATVLNTTYFFTKMVYLHPINYYDDERIYKTDANYDCASELLEKRWVHLKQVLDKLKTTAGKAEEKCSDTKLKASLRSVKRLALAIAQTVGADSKLYDGAYISSDDLFSLTEIAWYFLAMKIYPSNSSYLSWSELMTSIGISRTNAKAEIPIKSRPSISELESAKKAIEGALGAATLARSRQTFDDVEGAHAMQDQSYRAYAKLLYTQASMHHQAFIGKKETTERIAGNRTPASDANTLIAAQRKNATGPKTGETRPDGYETPPFASAIVTTFDVELELALRRFQNSECFDKRYGSKHFMVVVPANVVVNKGTGRRSTSIWMGYIVDPEVKDSHEAILSPKPSQWFVFGRADTDSSQSNSDAKRLGIDDERIARLLAENPMPIIIKINGSPLVGLPNIFERNNDEDLGSLKEQIIQRAGYADARAMVEDEDSATELENAIVLEEHHALHLSYPELLVAEGRDLPISLIDPQNRYWRYWTLLGVSLSSNPVRYRLI
ncbi:MAG: hypothetical protein LBI64_06905, partial [Coriobacteriales bacterium]|nr:hypothetical protein [Coriobacteriales bacterium]